MKTTLVLMKQRRKLSVLISSNRTSCITEDWAYVMLVQKTFVKASRVASKNLDTSQEKPFIHDMQQIRESGEGG